MKTTKKKPKTEQREPQSTAGPSPEAALIGAILLDPKPVISLVLHLVTGGDFADSDLGKLYTALVILHEAGKPVVDIAWLHRELQKMEDVPASVKTMAALSRISNSVVNVAHCVFHADQIAEGAQKRRLELFGTELLERARDPEEEPEQIIEWAACKLAETRANEKTATQSIGEIGAAVIADLERPEESPKVRIFTGLIDVDSTKGPSLGGNVVLIAARPSGGKSAKLSQVTVHNAENGRRVLFVSLEMTGREIFERMACSSADVDSRKLRDGTLSREDIDRLKIAHAEIKSLPIQVFDPQRANVMQISAAARHTKATGGLDLVCVDYVQLIDPLEHETKLRRFEQLASVSRELKCLAKELGVVVMCAAQLNRESDKFDEPRLSHLADCSAFEKDADEVLFLSHPPISGPAAAEVASARSATIVIGKARHAPTGSRIRVLWHPMQTRFSTVPTF